MNTAQSFIPDFLGQNPIGSKVSVLLLNELQATNFRESAKAIPIRIKNEKELQSHITAVRKESRSHGLLSFLDVVANTLIASGTPPVTDGVTYFPFFARSGGAALRMTGSYIEINQNAVEAKSLSSFQSFFTSARSDLRPKIVFVVDDFDRASKTFAKLNSLSDTFVPIPTGVNRINLPDEAANEFERLYFTRYENHRSAAIADIKQHEDPRVNFINSLMQLRSKKICLDPTPLIVEAQRLSDFANHKLVQAKKEDQHFWTSAWIHSLLEHGYLRDGAKVETQSAMGMLRMIDDDAIATHVLRFTNQILGTSSEALEYLKRGRKRFESMDSSSFAFQMYQPSFYGLLQNQHATELFQETESDPGLAESSYEFVKSTAPFFTNLAMLGNTAALGYLSTGNPTKALHLFDKIRNDNADDIDRWNIDCNRLIAMKLATGDVEPRDIKVLADSLIASETSQVWEYQVLRVALNLIEIDSDKVASSDLWELVKKSKYFAKSKRKTPQQYQEIIIGKDFSDQTSSGKLTGQLGKFFYDKGLFPAADFDWT